MKEITHNKTAAPKYEDAHEVEQRTYDAYDYVYIDVETDASSPQRPIFAFAYDEESKKAYVGMDEIKVDNEMDMDLSRDEVKQVVKSQVEEEGYKIKELDYTPHLGEAYIENIIDDVAKYNEAREDERMSKGIAGHNVFFDLGMLTGADEDLLIDRKISHNEVDGALSAGDYTITHKRAGVDGRLYQFYNNLVPERTVQVLDTMTAAKSLQKPGKLSKLAKYFDIDNIEVEDEEHGVLNEDYIRYNINDVIVTKIIKENLEYTLSEIMKIGKPIHWIYSPASIAKEKMVQMGYDRVEYTNLALKICSWEYFGGQTEALKIAEEIQECDYTDILSEYPTVSGLTNVWPNYMHAEKIDVEEVDADELPIPTLDELKDIDMWEKISKYVVLVDMKKGKAPVRTDLTNKNTTRVYKANVVESKMHMHLMDLIGSTIAGECEYEILKAYEVVTEGKQELESTEIGDTTIEAYDDLMVKTIEERKRKQKEIGGKNEETKSFKLVGNSGYGVTAERIVKSLTTQGGEIEKRYDVAGKYFNPHVASTITAGGRLLLGIGEAIAKQNGGEMYYCDTDSLIMDSNVSQNVIDYMNNLNPYDGVAGNLDVLEVEDEDVCVECCGYYDGKKCVECGCEESEEIMLDDVSLIAIDVKKYAIVKDGEIVSVKEHGLGHYDNMRNKERVVNFWKTLLQRLGLAKEEWKGLENSTLQEMVKWQTSASTYRIRKQLSELQNRFVKYGDFLQRTISVEDGDEIVYIGTSLEQECIKINIDKQTYETVESIDDDNTKDINDVLMEWQTRAYTNEDGRPTVTITNTEKVNKESQGIKLAYENSMSDAMRDVELDTLF